LECLWIPNGTRGSGCHPPSEYPSEYTFRSPAEFAAELPADIDYLIIQGCEDRIIPLGQAEKLKAAIADNGANVELRVIGGLGHVPAPDTDQAEQYGRAIFGFLTSK